MKSECDKVSCVCATLADLPDDVLEKEVERRNQLWKRQEEGAEMRRHAFIKDQWRPPHYFWLLLQATPLFTLVLINKISPQISAMYHGQLVFATVVFTIGFILLYHWKRYVVEREFQKRYPEDAQILSFSYLD
jgi:hypothetical protein